MDQVDKMKLTKYGFNLTLLRASYILSVLGIVVSIIGLIGSITYFVIGAKTGPGYFVFGGFVIGTKRDGGGYFDIGVVLLILTIPYLIMWIFLKIKTSKKNILDIERIGKNYSYVSGSLEIIATLALIIFSAYSLKVYHLRIIYPQIVLLVGSAIYLVFACLKMHGVRVENNKVVEIYLGFRYGLFFLHVIGFIVLSIYSRDFDSSIFVFTIYFILDIGLTVILHSIRVNRENTARTEAAITLALELAK